MAATPPEGARVRRVHPHLEERRTGDVAVLRIDREEALGALSRSIVEALGGYLTELAADDTARVLVLTGTGKGFIAGADVSEYDGVSRAEFDDYQELSGTVFGALEALPQISLAAVNGYALGGGFELALCCDLIVASERARFGLPELKLGLIPGGGGTQRLTRALGTRYTKELLLTSRFVHASELAERGLLVGVHPAEELLERAEALAATIATTPALAARAAKRVVAEGADLELPAALALERAQLSELFATEDGKEGIAAMRQKRQPRFLGR